jgi:hypothetical protein
MDFTQLRKLDAPGGKRATDEAIELFVNSLNDFFVQFEGLPTALHLQTYKTYMDTITQKVNESEYNYYLKRYQIEFPDDAEVMAETNKLSSFKDIPTRMQYWAASHKWGDSIRNARNHVKAVKSMEAWAAMFNHKRHYSFFQKEQNEQCPAQEISKKTKP